MALDISKYKYSADEEVKQKEEDIIEPPIRVTGDDDWNQLVAEAAFIRDLVGKKQLTYDKAREYILINHQDMMTSEILRNIIYTGIRDFRVLKLVKAMNSKRIPYTNIMEFLKKTVSWLRHMEYLSKNSESIRQKQREKADKEAEILKAILSMRAENPPKSYAFIANQLGMSIHAVYSRVSPIYKPKKLR